MKEIICFLSDYYLILISILPFIICIIKSYMKFRETDFFIIVLTFELMSNMLYLLSDNWNYKVSIISNIINIIFYLYDYIHVYYIKRIFDKHSSGRYIEIFFLFCFFFFLWYVIEFENLLQKENIIKITKSISKTYTTIINNYWFQTISSGIIATVVGGLILHIILQKVKNNIKKKKDEFFNENSNNNKYFKG